MAIAENFEVWMQIDQACHPRAGGQLRTNGEVSEVVCRECGAWYAKFTLKELAQSEMREWVRREMEE